MHSSQYIALARHFDNEFASITAMHFLPGATPTQDGAALVLCRDDEHSGKRDAPVFCAVTVHVGVPHRGTDGYGPGEPGVDVLVPERRWTTEADALGQFMDYIEASIND